MSNFEKVIDSIGRCICHVPDACRDCAYAEHPYNICWEMLLRDAIALLKAQEQVKPYVSGKGKDFENASTWWYACGNCDNPIDPNDKYCRHCGRKVKWDD